jgi:hypothetical protein
MYTYYQIINKAAPPRYPPLSSSSIVSQQQHSPLTRVAETAQATRHPPRKYSASPSTHRMFSASSTFTATSSHAADVSDMFWVPDDIARKAKLDKQRSSLPNAHICTRQHHAAVVDGPIDTSGNLSAFSHYMPTISRLRDDAIKSSYTTMSVHTITRHNMSIWAD